MAAVALIAELVAPRLVERQTEQVVATEVPEASEVTATAGDMPFLPPLAREGRVGSLEVTIRDVTTPAVTVAEVGFRFEDVLLDRRALLRRELVVRDIGNGRVRAEVAAEDVVDALDLPTDRLPADLADAFDVEAGLLELADQAAGSVQLPGGLLPCDPTVTADDAVLVLTCEFSELPEVLRDTAIG